jgi:MoaA/NifB/PqqE/SkfB family radical SAM enzyme
MPGTHGWAEIDAERKRELIAAIRSGAATRGPAHIELDLTDRCNVACYFCNQEDLRTKESIPLAKLTSMVDELQATGLKSVRLSGGGDPLFHREVVPFLDHLLARRIVVDNLTTNGAALTEDVAVRLVRGKAREVVISLNAVDADDHARMMRVSPRVFDRVLENVRALVRLRDGAHPFIVVQFLLDRRNAHRLVEMYELGASLGVDRIAVNGVLYVPNEGLDPANLLVPEDWDALAPAVEEILRRDRNASLLNIDFPIADWSEKLQAIRGALGIPARNLFPHAPTFDPENHGCFFAWYTAAVTGNGDIRPCCFMLNPAVKPLGNIHETATFAEQWHGPSFARMREEMREVLLAGSNASYSPDRYEILGEQCVTPFRCWLKNAFFRNDEEFYRELGEALKEMRLTEMRYTAPQAPDEGKA